LIASIFKYQLPFRKTYLYAPHGPVVNFKELKDNNFNFNDFLFEIPGKNIFKENQPIFFRIEPGHQADYKEDYFKDFNFQNTEDVQPAESLVLDLTQSEEYILGNMEHDTRYAVRAAERRGVEISIIENPLEKQNVFEKEFWPLFEDTNKRHGLRIYPKRYYLEVVLLNGDCRSKIFMARINNQVIAAAIIIFWAKTAVYLYAASEANYGRLNAPTLILWWAITDAQKQGYQIFDFWGISHKKKEWGGVTAFKKSFGGKEIHYLGTWDFIFDKKWYFFYQAAKRFKRF